MNRDMTLGVLLASALGAVFPATAQTIYRCGQSYSQQPCPGGTAVQADDPRSDSQRAQTRDAAKRDAKVADEMQKARLKEEAKPVQALIPEPKLDAPEPAPPAVTGVARKPAYFTAVSPKKAKGPDEKKKKKAKKKTSQPARVS